MRMCECTSDTRPMPPEPGGFFGESPDNCRYDSEAVLSPALITVAALLTSALGALGGLGGAVLLVPLLVVAGLSVTDAAPLGLLSVVAGSVAAGARQLGERSVNHRIGVTTEFAATFGSVTGALISGVLPERVLVVLLAVVALAAAFAGGRRTGLRNLPDPGLGVDDVGERVGALVGVYPLGADMVPYRVVRLPLGLSLMTVAGFVAGTAGASGGFIKTPAMSEVMHVPTKVAAATTTFTIGVTASAALVVMAVQGRIDPVASAGVIFGGITGGWLGARVQAKLSPAGIRRGLSAALVVVAVILLVTA